MTVHYHSQYNTRGVLGAFSFYTQIKIGICKKKLVKNKKPWLN